MADPLTSMHTCVDDRRQQRLWVPLWHAIEQKALAPAQLQPSQDCLQTQRTWINCLDLLKTSSIHCQVCDEWIKQWNQGTYYLADCILSGLIVHCQRFQELQNSEKFRPTARPQCKALNAQEFDLDVLESVQNSEENSLTREILVCCDGTTDSSDQYPWNSTPCHPHQSLPQCNVCHLTSLSKCHPS